MKRKMIISALMVFCVLVGACGPPSREEVERSIENAPLLKEADKLCRETPTPPGFEFVAKRPGTTRTYGLIDFVYSGDLPSAEVLSFYEDHFAKIGWKRTSFDKGRYGSAFTSVQFSHRGRYVAIENLKSRGSDYTVSCGVFKKHE